MGATFDSTAYAYPWDVAADSAAATRIARSGVSSVTLAAAYHSVRAATPRHPEHRIVEASSAAVYLPVRESAWAGQRLVPRDGAAWAGADSFARARDALARAGVAVQSWLALTHADGVAEGGSSASAALDLCAVNAFGDVYSYALCPSNVEVRRYASTLTFETVASSGVDGVVIEACGPMGCGHQSTHEKTGGADWNPFEEALLSVCFCAGCCVAYDERGGSAAGAGGADDLRRSVRNVVRSGEAPGGGGAQHQAQGGPSTTLDDSIRRALGDAVADVLLGARRSASRALTTSVLEAAGAAGAARVTMHCSSEAWSTGPFSALDDDARELDVVVAAAWAQSGASVAEVARTHLAVHPSTAVGAYCTVLPPTPIDVPQTVGHWSALLAAGASELHLYHVGLASDARLDLIDASLEALASPSAPSSAPVETSLSPTTLSKEHSHD